MFYVPTQSDGPGCRNPDAQRGRLLSRHALDRSSGTANGNFQERGPRTTQASSPNWPRWTIISFNVVRQAACESTVCSPLAMASFSRSDMTPALALELWADREPVHDYLHRLCSISYESGYEKTLLPDVARVLAAIILTGPIGVVSHHWHGIAQILGSRCTLKAFQFQ